jgi:hypothetical protein
MNTITFLCMAGDVTLGWDNDNDENMKALIEKKMKEGYTFFVKKKNIFAKTCLTKLKPKDLNDKNTKTVIMTDKEYERMLTTVNDTDVVTFARDKKGRFCKRAIKSTDLEDLEKAKTPSDVINSENSVAVRPIKGGIYATTLSTCNSYIIDYTSSRS